MSNKQNDELLEDLYYHQIKWLEEHGRTRSDIMEDEKGEYIMVEPNLMDEGEEESTKMVKVYLPTLESKISD